MQRVYWPDRDATTRRDIFYRVISESTPCVIRIHGLDPDYMNEFYAEASHEEQQVDDRNVRKVTKLLVLCRCIDYLEMQRARQNRAFQNIASKLLR